MFSDREAKFRTFERIQQIAQKARRAGGLTGHGYFNVNEYIMGPLRYQIEANLEIVIFEINEFTVPSFVKYEDGNKIKLYVESSIWVGSDSGLPLPRFILSHEIGHILMHTHKELAFSSNTSTYINSLEPERRTEAQANLFADLFLLPEDQLIGFNNVDDVSDYLKVPPDCAGRRLEHIRASKKPISIIQHNGEACAGCGNFAVHTYNGITECNICKNCSLRTI